MLNDPFLLYLDTADLAKIARGKYDEAAGESVIALVESYLRSREGFLVVSELHFYELCGFDVSEDVMTAVRAMVDRIPSLFLNFSALEILDAELQIAFGGSKSFTGDEVLPLDGEFFDMIKRAVKEQADDRRNMERRLGIARVHSQIGGLESDLRDVKLRDVHQMFLSRDGEELEEQIGVALAEDCLSDFQWAKKLEKKYRMTPDELKPDWDEVETKQNISNMRIVFHQQVGISLDFPADEDIKNRFLGYMLWFNREMRKDDNLERLMEFVGATGASTFKEVEASTRLHDTAHRNEERISASFGISVETYWNAIRKLRDEDVPTHTLIGAVDVAVRYNMKQRMPEPGDSLDVLHLCYAAVTDMITVDRRTFAALEAVPAYVEHGVDRIVRGGNWEQVSRWLGSPARH